jgi:hypothetical protein
MNLRGKVWVLGLIGLGIIAALLAGDGPTRQRAPLVMLIAVCMIGLVAELAVLARELPRSAARPAIPAGALPADGRAELVPIASCRTEPNECDPRLRQFLALDATESIPRARTRPPSEALLGQVVILSLFLGKDGQMWRAAEIAQAYKSLLRAAEWIETEAMRWQAPVNMVVSDTYFLVDDDAKDEVEIAFQPEGEHDGPMEGDADTKALVAFSRAAARLGFADSAELVAQVAARIEADAWVWLVHPRCEGRSHAIPACDTALPGVTLAVCYAREASFPQPLTGRPYADPVTFAHELLHIFGASDKYTVPLQSFSQGQVTERDVMFLNYERLSQLRIDPLTASEIGWNTPPKA